MFHNGYGSHFDVSPYASGGSFTQNSSLVTASGVALASYFRSDNTGPPDSLEEIDAVFAAVKKQFPDAAIFGSTFDAFAAEIEQADLEELEIMTAEWGDPWLGGLMTDPYRIQVYREMLRARDECLARPLGAAADEQLWDLSQGHRCNASSVALRNMTRWLSKISEHTQGVPSSGE